MEPNKIINVVAVSWDDFKSYCIKSGLKPNQARYISCKEKAAGLTGEVIVYYDRPMSFYRPKLSETIEFLRNEPHVTLRWG